jgi:putative ABC transport system substrate-binding protein
VFKQGLAELGYVDGKNIRIDYREGVLDADYHAVMAEFVGRKVNIILAANAPAAVAAAKATSSIPIVMLAVNDPVGLGLVKSLDHPDTNVTGTTMYAPQLIGERLRILKSIIPGLDKIAVVMNGNNANNAAQVERIRSDARALGIDVVALDIRRPEDVEPNFDRAAASGVKAFVNAVDSFINSRRFALAAEAEKRNLPAIRPGRRPDGARAGSLRGLPWRGEIRGQDSARRQSRRSAGYRRDAVHVQRPPAGAGQARSEPAARRQRPRERLDRLTSSKPAAQN